MRTVTFKKLGLLAMLATGSAFAQELAVVDQAADEQARESWREAMHNIAAPYKGCFHASYPSTRWEAVECRAAPGYRTKLPMHGPNSEQVVGNGKDYVAEAPTGKLFSQVRGSFPKVTGVTSEQSIGVLLFGGGGILGPNEYTLQVNTNFFHSAACGSYTNCIAWQQYVLSTNTPVSLTSSQLTGDTEVFIEYWLINYGTHQAGADICPAGFIDGGKDSEGPGDDCVQNTPATLVATGQIPITDLAGLTLSGSAKANGLDAATTTYGGEAYTATVADSLTDISSGWSEAEFNVVGNAGGSRADFNTPSSLTVKVAVADGSTTAPTCLPPANVAGTTGETNNLTAGRCVTAGGTVPYIEFVEAN